MAGGQPGVACKVAKWTRSSGDRAEGGGDEGLQRGNTGGSQGNILF